MVEKKSEGRWEEGASMGTCAGVTGGGRPRDASRQCRPLRRAPPAGRPIQYGRSRIGETPGGAVLARERERERYTMWWRG